MTTMAASSYSGTLVNPPKRTPATPDDGAIPGQAPASGAGSITTPPPLVTDPVVGGLPFGNGVTPPVSQAAPGADGSLQDTNISPAGPTAFDGGPAILGSPTGGAAILPENDPRLAGAQATLDQSVGALANTDRRSMLNSLLGDFDTQQREADNGAYTDAGRASAAFGRIGSGMTGDVIGQIGRQSMRDRNIFRNQLAADTIDKEIGDRFSKTSLFRGLAGDAFGQGQDNRNERRGERGYVDNRGDKYLDDSRGERAFKYGVGRDNYGNAQDYRNELRGERGYQDSRDSYRTDRAVEGAKLSDYLTGSAFDRNTQRYAAGKAGSPYAGSNYAGAAADAQGQSDATMNALMQFLQSLGIGSK